MKKIFLILGFVGLVVMFSGCTSSIEVSPNLDNVQEKDDKNIDFIPKKERYTDIVLLDYKKQLSPKDKLWCELESQRSFVEIMDVAKNIKTYNEGLDYFNSLPQEKASFFAYNITSHLLKMSCVDDKKNDEINLNHSITSINNSLGFLDASLCATSEKLIFSREVSLRSGKDLNYKDSLSVFDKLDPYLKNQVINTLTNYLEERQCAK